jgi:hypothetical protein
VINHHGTLLPSVYLWLPVIGVAVLLCLGLIWLALRYAQDNEDDGTLSLIPGLGALVLIIAPLFCYYPYSGDYHRLQPVTGVVQAVDSRFLAASQYVVVTYDTGLTVRCDDSRCATVRTGESLQLLCTKEHQFGSPLATDGWGCRWGSGAA